MYPASQECANGLGFLMKLLRMLCADVTLENHNLPRQVHGTISNHMQAVTTLLESFMASQDVVLLKSWKFEPA